MDFASVLCSAIGILAAIIMSLLLPGRKRTKTILWVAAITAAGSLFIYTRGIAQLGEPVGVAAMRVVFSVVKSVGGGENWKDVEKVLTAPWERIFFWVVHMLGLFASASAIITAFGTLFGRHVRMWKIAANDLNIIYGLTTNTLSFGQELIEKTGAPVLFVDANPEAGLAEAAWNMGGAVRSDPKAVSAELDFIKRIGMKPAKKKLYLYALSPNYLSNYNYAKQLLTGLRALGVNPLQLGLTLMGPSDETENALMAVRKKSPKEASDPDFPEFRRYGYSNVIAVDEPDMVGRLLAQKYPPCKVLRFDENGKATTDFHGLIIGYGMVGQAVLRHLVMNSQFHGSTFHLAVFDPEYEKSNGRIAHECSAMLDAYDIKFYPFDGRSSQLYDYITQNAHSLNYIVVCAGKAAVNEEIADQLHVYLRRKGGTAPVYMCSHWGVFYHNHEGQLEMHRIYTDELLHTVRIDKMAMVLNHRHAKKKAPILTCWHEASYFDRMSSRASADFQDSLLYMAGVTEQEAKEAWEPTGELLENLAITEHMRWNAFHYCMGFRPMTQEEFKQRSKTYDEDRKKDSNHRLGKDLDKRIHGCITDWDKLPAYARKESEVTGSLENYQEYDRDFVRAIGKVLLEADATRLEQ